MRAIVQKTYGTADVLEFTEIDPPSIGEDEVLIAVRAAGVHIGDHHLMTGRPYPVRLVSGLRAPRKPVPGMDVAGRVERVGAKVTRFAPGDEVFGTCTGAFAEYARAREDRIAPKPANLTFEQAATVPTSAPTALQGLRDKGGLGEGRHVAITGAGGGVGTFAVQLAKAFGAEVTAVCGPTKADTVRSLGADHVIDYTREDFTDGTRRYDVILDAAGHRPIRRLRRVLAPRGRLVIVGAETGGKWLGGLDRPLRAAMLSPLTRQRLGGLVAVDRVEDLEYLTGLIEAGKVTPVIGRSHPLAETAEALRYLGTGHALGKVVVTV
ncbi:NAD(P)-dependent alcohol dehydrogenase [Streptomyces calidiresistens]